MNIVLEFGGAMFEFGGNLAKYEHRARIWRIWCDVRIWRDVQIWRDVRIWRKSAQMKLTKTQLRKKTFMVNFLSPAQWRAFLPTVLANLANKKMDEKVHSAP